MRAFSQFPREWFFLVILISVYCAIFIPFTIIRHGNFNSLVCELGINDQLIWNTLHGRIMASTVEDGINNYLGDHFSPVLFLAVPFYFIYANPVTLLILQTLILASGALPVFLIAAHEIRIKWVSLVFGGCYLAMPAVGFINRFDFHELSFFVPLALWAIFFLKIQKAKISIVFFGLCLFVKEETGLAVAGFGCYLLLFERDKARTGLVLLVSGVFWSLFVMFVVIPMIRGGGESDTFQRYIFFGETPQAIIKNVLAHPADSFKRVFSYSPRIIFLVKLFLPAGFLCLFSPGLLIPLIPYLIYSLLSGNPSQSSIYYHYSAPAIPFITVSSIMGFKRITESKTVSKLISGIKRTSPMLPCYLILFTLCAQILDNPVLKKIGPPYYKISGTEKRTNQNEILEAGKLIPEDASLTAANHLGAHFSQREIVRVFLLYSFIKTDYILVDLKEPGEQIGILQDFREKYYNTLYELMNMRNPCYRIEYSKNEILLLKKIDNDNDNLQNPNSHFEVYGEIEMEVFSYKKMHELIDSAKKFIIEKNYENALEEIDKAISAVPLDPRPFMIKGLIFEYQGYYNQALEAWLQVEKMLPGHEEVVGHINGLKMKL